MDYLKQDEFVSGIYPAVFKVDSAWLSDDGFFRSTAPTPTPEPEIASFTGLWARTRPNPDSIVVSVWLKRADGTEYRYGVLATNGKNEKGFDSPIAEWEAEFTYSSASGSWNTPGFQRMKVTIPR